MSIRTTVTLDDDVALRLQDEARARGKPFRQTINDILRLGLMSSQAQAETKRKFRLPKANFGLRPELNYDNIEELISQIEGDKHR